MSPTFIPIASAVLANALETSRTPSSITSSNASDKPLFTKVSAAAEEKCLLYIFTSLLINFAFSLVEAFSIPRVNSFLTCSAASLAGALRTFSSNQEPLNNNPLP